MPWDTDLCKGAAAITTSCGDAKMWSCSNESTLAPHTEIPPQHEPAGIMPIWHCAPTLSSSNKQCQRGDHAVLASGG